MNFSRLPRFNSSFFFPSVLRFAPCRFFLSFFLSFFLPSFLPSVRPSFLPSFLPSVLPSFLPSFLLFLKDLRAPFELVKWVADHGRLPVVSFAAGGVAAPADAALMMQLGMDGVFVGSGIFKSSEPAKRAKAIVEAVTHFNNAKKLAEISMNLGQPMVGITDLVLDPVNFRDREAGEEKK
jgi:hypothetical protein